jgi:hypothetical protein
MVAPREDIPSIPREFSEFEAYVFDKLDGSNLRFEWKRKGGWYKYGTRHRLFDATDPGFGSAIELSTTHLLHRCVISFVMSVMILQ